MSLGRKRWKGREKMWHGEEEEGKWQRKRKREEKLREIWELKEEKLDKGKNKGKKIREEWKLVYRKW
jgi:hypothetical protein